MKMIMVMVCGFYIGGAAVVGAVGAYAIGLAGMHKVQDACRDKQQAAAQAKTIVWRVKK